MENCMFIAQGRVRLAHRSTCHLVKPGQCWLGLFHQLHSISIVAVPVSSLMSTSSIGSFNAMAHRERKKTRASKQLEPCITHEHDRMHIHACLHDDDPIDMHCCISRSSPQSSCVQTQRIYMQSTQNNTP